MPGNSARMCSHVDVGRRARIPHDCVRATMPFTARVVTSSIRRRCRTLTFKLKNDKKSDPRMGWATEAIVKTHRKVRLSPMSMVRERSPKVWIMEPFAACKGEPGCLCRRSTAEDGRTLISAPVSTRKRWPLMRSAIKNRRLRDWPTSLTATSDRPGRFPARNMGCGTVEHFQHMCGGTSTNLLDGRKQGDYVDDLSVNGPRNDGGMQND